MTAAKPLLAVLKGTTDRRPPVWLMRQAGRYLPEYRAVRTRVRGFLELCYTPDLAAEVTLQPVRRYGMDGAILFSDILVVPHALGWDVRFVEGEGPRLAKLSSADDLDRLDASALHGRLAPVYETVRRVRAAMPPETTLIGFSGAPWTLAAYMIEGGGSKDFQTARTLARRRPELVQALVDRLEAAVVDHLAAQVAAGAEALQLFDSWAGVLPPEEVERWCQGPARRIVAGVRVRCPEVPIIVFPRGIGASYAAFAAAVGADAVGLDTTVPMGWAARHVHGAGDRPLCLQGNLDPIALLGPQDALVERAGAIVRQAAGRPHVFNLGHGVVPETPPEAVARLVGYLKSLAD